VGGSIFRLRSIAARGALAALLLLLSVPTLVIAQAGQDGEDGEDGATVHVHLKDASGAPAAGEVSLKNAEGKTIASCTAAAGRCEMTGVPGGSYRVHVEPVEGKPPKPTRAMIPPEGEVTLHVSTGS
jgi:hypothetical protein